jgi:uncharacterized protein (DUF2345 family)
MHCIGFGARLIDAQSRVGAQWPWWSLRLPWRTNGDQLGAQKALQATLASLRGVEGGADTDESGGGQGRIPVTQRPDLVLSAAGDIASLTPAHTVLSTGQHTTLTAGQDTNLLAQRHQAWAVKDGISLFTRGEAKDTQHGVQEVGIKLHAASGNVSAQAQSGAFTLTAEKAIDVQSTTASIVISAPSKLLLNGGGGYIKIEGGDIELGTRGPASFKAGMKELTSGGSASRSGVSMPVPASLPTWGDIRFSHTPRLDPSILDSGAKPTDFVAQTYSTTGELLHSTPFDASGEAQTYFTKGIESLICIVSKADDAWIVVSSDRPPSSTIPNEIPYADFS